MIFASTLGKIVQPLFEAFAWALAGFYSIIPNYAIAIALLTIAVMIVVFPITRKATRSMMKMQLLAPELKKIQARYKTQPGMTVAERQENRQKLNEEMMALYRENGASPTGGCLPMLLQFPAFIILYDTIRGLTHRTPSGKLDPLYISHSTSLYHAIMSAHGAMVAFGINLADSVRSTGLSWPAKIPFIALILIAIALQYVQMKQLSGRNPAAAQANPQMQQMQKIFPIVFAIIYISIPAGVNIYFIVSSLFRIGQQEYMYRRDHELRASLDKLRERSKSDPKVVEARLNLEGKAPPQKGLFSRLLAAGEAMGARGSAPNPTDDEKPKAQSLSGRASTGSRRENKKPPSPPPPNVRNRSQNKRPRRAR